MPSPPWLDPGAIVAIRSLVDPQTVTPYDADPPWPWIAASAGEARRLLQPDAYCLRPNRGVDAKSLLEVVVVAGADVYRGDVTQDGRYLRLSGELWEIEDPGTTRAWRELIERSATEAEAWARQARETG